MPALFCGLFAPPPSPLISNVQHCANRAHALLKEANIDFTRTMNKIVFDLHLQHASAEGLMPLVSALPKR